MPVQAVYANPAVRQLQGRVAIMRGPVIYCMEGVDNGNIVLDRISLDPAAVPSFKVERRDDLLGGVTVLHGQGTLIDDADWDDQTLYRPSRPSAQKQTEVMAIPYALWDNRAPGEMRVWFRTA